MFELIPEVQNENKYAIAMASSNLYVPYLTVYLKSIISNINEDNFYEIIILESDISDLNKQIIYNITEQKNVKIKFVNVDSIFSEKSLHIEYNYFAKQCYYRLAVGEIFKNYQKVIYTDIDTLVNSDIFDLFNIDLNGKPIAACIEFIWSLDIFKEEYIKENLTVADYIKNIVEVEKYFNTGVIIVDIKRFNDFVTLDKLIEIAENNKFINQEQCVLNKVFNENIYSLDYICNFEIYYRIYTNSNKYCKEYMNRLDEAKIYHFLTNKKVWFYPELPKGNLWWEYARQTPFYEEILARMIDNKINEFDRRVHNDLNNVNNSLLNYTNNVTLYRKNVLSYWKCKLLCNLTFGKKREHYIQKKKDLKAKIRQVKDLLR